MLSTNICCWHWFRKNFWLPANYALLWTLAWVPTPYTGLCEAKLTQIQQRFQFLKFETIVSFSTTRLFTTLFLSKESTSQILKINLIIIGHLTSSSSLSFSLLKFFLLNKLESNMYLNPHYCN